MHFVEGIEQGSQEWHNARRCKITGTRLADVMGSPLDRVTLISELIAQEATEQTRIINTTAAMERGNAEEPFAIAAYEARTGSKVKRGAFCVSDEFDWVALSPDGLMKEGKKYTRAVEVKSPESHTAVFYRLTNMVGMERLGLGTYLKATKDRPYEIFKPSSKEPFLGIPAEYKWQVVHYFVVNTDLKELDFLVYDARFIADSDKLYTVTITHEMPELQQAISEARAELIKFRKDWMEWKSIIMPDNF